MPASRSKMDCKRNTNIRYRIEAAPCKILLVLRLYSSKTKCQIHRTKTPRNLKTLLEPSDSSCPSILARSFCLWIIGSTNSQLRQVKFPVKQRSYWALFFCFLILDPNRYLPISLDQESVFQRCCSRLNKWKLLFKHNALDQTRQITYLLVLIGTTLRKGGASNPSWINKFEIWFSKN